MISCKHPAAAPAGSSCGTKQQRPGFEDGRGGKQRRWAKSVQGEVPSGNLT